MKDFKGKTAFVTGSASGIGLGMAKAFARAGMNVVLADIEKPALDEAEETIAGLGAEVLAIPLDVSQRDAVADAAQQTVTAFGKVHVLCNNAGVGGRSLPLDQITSDDWDWVLGVNLLGTINGLLAFIPLIKSHGEGGHIVTTSSMSGLRAFLGRGQGCYVTTKFGLVGLSEYLRGDLEPHGIGVSVLCPGYVQTRMVEAGRNRPERYGGPYHRSDDDPMARMARADPGRDPDLVGQHVLEAIQANDLYIMTDPGQRHFVVDRHAVLMDAFDRAETWYAAHES